MVRPLAPGAKVDSPDDQHVQRFISRAFTYGAVGLFVLSQTTWFHLRLDYVGLGPDNFDSYPSRTLCNRLEQKFKCVHCDLAHQAVHPFGVAKLAPAISRSNKPRR